MSYGAGIVHASFVAGAIGPWAIERITALRGATLPSAARLAIYQGEATSPEHVWMLHGVASHARYVEAHEKVRLDAISPPLGRPEAVCAALVPIRKTPAWWALPQDERRAIFEARSHHIAASLPYLPRIARRLHHARDLGGPFDFLTWFEFAPEHAAAFDELASALRETEEWTFVEAEVDVRVRRV
jgi:chlorite dismutase